MLDHLEVHQHEMNSSRRDIDSAVVEPVRLDLEVDDRRGEPLGRRSEFRRQLVEQGAVAMHSLKTASFALALDAVSCP